MYEKIRVFFVSDFWLIPAKSKAFRTLRVALDQCKKTSDPEVVLIRSAVSTEEP